MKVKVISLAVAGLINGGLQWPAPMFRSTWIAYHGYKASQGTMLRGRRIGNTSGRTV